jgi:hypothetical protein
LFSISIAVLAFLYFRVPEDTEPVRFTIEAPSMLNGVQVSVSPDGRRIAFIARTSGLNSIFVRPLDSVRAQQLPGTGGAGNPFWSPDSQSIGFFADGKLKKVDMSGGPAQSICDARNGGGTWNTDGTILFGSITGGMPLQRVSSQGGQAVPVTKIDPSQQQTGHSWPYFLPDGRHYLYLAWSEDPAKRAIYAGTLDSQETQMILAAESMPVYTEPGYLCSIGKAYCLHRSSTRTDCA